MKLYLLSLGVGVLVGILYSALNVRSPAPPIVALIGLFGMLLGEQVGPVARRLLAGEALSAAWFSRECAPKITGVSAPESDHGDHASR
ncbi:XapX domain-containing protein [Sorangium sp. So ce1078]|uniref:XapX domain-containing protein n=1 Tax=Sorangium sp. So ce1078 TaxID=3133329 RepID=UPI003F618BB4